MNIKRKPTPKGIRSQLTYWYKGIRSRFILGYNLTEKEEHEEAEQAMKDARAMQEAKPRGKEPTLAEFVPTYLKEMEQKRVVDTRRNIQILNTHLLPALGHKRLSMIQREHGVDYIIYRRKLHARDGTIEREMGVLMAVLNLAVDCEVLDKNRLKRVAIPRYEERKRVATEAEIKSLLELANVQLYRAILIALHTGLREGRIIAIDQSWIIKELDGYWLHLPKARTEKKGNAPKLPLNAIALAALRPPGAVIYLHGRRIFDNWAATDSFRNGWSRLCKKAGITDLRFHDLRHTFSTRLQDLGVPLEVRSALLGHKIKGSATPLYSHGGFIQMREAVTKLEEVSHGSGSTSTRIRSQS